MGGHFLGISGDASSHIVRLWIESTGWQTIFHWFDRALIPSCTDSKLPGTHLKTLRLNMSRQTRIRIATVQTHCIEWITWHCVNTSLKPSTSGQGLDVLPPLPPHPNQNFPNTVHLHLHIHLHLHPTGYHPVHHLHHHPTPHWARARRARWCLPPP